MIVRRSKISRVQSLGIFLLGAVGLQFVFALSGGSDSSVAASVALAVLVGGFVVLVWSRLLTKISLDREKLVVESPLRRREFLLSNDLVVSHSHGGTTLVSRAGWPFFVFDPTAYDLTEEQQQIVRRVISGTGLKESE